MISIDYPNFPFHPSRGLDIYFPNEINHRLPFIFFVHGGAWISNSRSDFQKVGQMFSIQGFVTIIAGYRLSNREQIDTNQMHPMHIKDVAEGLELVSNGVNHLSKNHPIVLIGHSAGAQLTGLLALQPERWIQKETADNILG